MEEFINVNKVDFEKLPHAIAKSTLYRWTKKYPEMFKRIGGRVFVNVEKLNTLLTNGESND